MRGKTDKIFTPSPSRRLADFLRSPELVEGRLEGSASLLRTCFVLPHPFDRLRTGKGEENCMVISHPFDNLRTGPFLSKAEGLRIRFPSPA